MDTKAKIAHPCKLIHLAKLIIYLPSTNLKSRFTFFHDH